MSTIKDPKSKKKLSLERDRRNTYGENSKSSRKNIAKGKQRQHQDERRTVAEKLRAAAREVDDEDAVNSNEHAARLAIVDSKRRGFRKKPDTPLGELLAKKQRKPTP
jgi:hypothetical protein